MSFRNIKILLSSIMVITCTSLMYYKTMLDRNSVSMFSYHQQGIIYVKTMKETTLEPMRNIYEHGRNLKEYAQNINKSMEIIKEHIQHVQNTKEQLANDIYKLYESNNINCSALFQNDTSEKLKSKRYHESHEKKPLNNRFYINASKNCTQVLGNGVHLGSLATMIHLFLFGISACISNCGIFVTRYGLPMK